MYIKYNDKIAFQKEMAQAAQIAAEEAEVLAKRSALATLSAALGDRSKAPSQQSGKSAMTNFASKIKEQVTKSVKKKFKVTAEEELKQDLRVYVSFTEAVPKEGLNDALYDNPERLFVHNHDKKVQTFEDQSMFYISFFSHSGCSIKVKLAFAEDPAARRREMLEKK